MKDAEDVDGPSGGPVVCEGCDAVHSWNFIGPLVKLAGGFEEYALTARLVMELDRVYKYGPTGPCGCWTSPDKEGQEKTPEVINLSIQKRIPGLVDDVSLLTEW